MNSKPCNVVMLPNKILAENIIKISESIHSDEKLFTLKDGSIFPHISLYMLELLTDDYPKVQEILRLISVSQSVKSLSAVRYGQAIGFLDSEYSTTPDLSRLQDLIVETLNPLRNGLREKDKPRLLEAEGIKREYFERYGYPHVGEFFRPHVTLTRFKHDDSYDISKLPDISNFSGEFDKIGFFESGDNGTCINLIGSYSLT